MKGIQIDTILLEHKNDLINALCDGSNLSVINQEFIRALDNVDHKILSANCITPVSENGP